ncbi:MAG: ketoacyl-ACP synthase III [Thiohalomonadaceae bacterium]
MAIYDLGNVMISGIACAVPETVVKAEQYYEVLGEDVVDKFVKTVGVKQRHLGGDSMVTTADLCYDAAEKLIKDLQINREEIIALILVTQTPDYIIPATACVLQYRLGLSEECLAYDVNLGCSGYVYGLYLAATHIKPDTKGKVLLLAGDAKPSRKDSIDRSQAMLFGDAGTATILEYTEKGSGMKCLLKTQGHGFKSLIKPCGGNRHPGGNMERTLRDDGTIRNDFETYMDGTAIFNFSISEVPKLFNEFNKIFNLSPEDFDFIAFHQANLFMLNYIAKKLKLPKEKMPISLDIYGNTSSASIPITICDYFNRNNQECDDKYYNVMGCGFGVGLSLGITTFQVHNKTCFPIITTNDSFEDELI